MTREAHALDMARLSPEAVATARLFYGRGGLPFVLAGRGWTFCPDWAALPGRWRACVHTDLGGRELAVFMDSLLPADWEASGLDPTALAELPTELAGAALELACRDLADTLTQTLGEPVRVNGLKLEQEDAWLPDEALCFTLIREDGQRVRGAMAAQGALLAEVAEGVSRAAPRLAADVSSLAAHCRILLAGPELGWAELSALETGDILLSGVAAADAHSSGLPMKLRVFGTAAPCAGKGVAAANARLFGTRVVMEGPMMQETPIQPDESAQEEHGAEDSAPVAADPGELPLAVAFDLGGVTLSVAEMTGLAPGMILETGRDLAAPVRITVAGKRIGTGSLCDVGGRIGVRIEWLNFAQV